MANKNTTLAPFDVVISGAGIVGCLSALALAKHTTFKILLLEANLSNVNDSTKTATLSTQTSIKHAGFDARVIALAEQSIRRLASLDVDITQIAHQAIDYIHVSDRHHMGQVRLSAQQSGVDALGQVVSVAQLGQYLLQQLLLMCNKDNATVSYQSPCKIEAVQQQQNELVLSLSDDSQVKTKLLLVSDGGNSQSAKLVGIKNQVAPYTQSAIITNISTQLPHNNTAYERFTSQGPIAFLPMSVETERTKQRTDKDNHYMSVVWCLDTKLAKQKLALNDDIFLQELNDLFGTKLGKFTSCSERFCYPLQLVQASPFLLHRALCIGNAAQTLHPIAGQGFNLGIRDVFDLITCIQGSADAGAFEGLNLYKNKRQNDKQATVFATDSLVSIFSNQYAPLIAGRNIGLHALNFSSPLKRTFAKYSMGER